MATTVNYRFQIAGKPSATLTSENPTPLVRELVVETDTGKSKIGDGSTAWSTLSYQYWWTKWGRIAGTLTDQADLAAALALLAPKASPAITGTPTAPTAATNTNTTQLATTAFVLAQIALATTGLLELKGGMSCSANPNYPAASAGDTYLVTAAGKIGGASGVSVDVGDSFIASADNAGGTQASVGSSWFVLEHNLAGALLSANNLSDLANAATARTNLGVAIGTNVQAFSADLAAIAALTSAADKLPYATGASTWAMTTLSSFIRTLLDDASASTARGTLGAAASGANTDITSLTSGDIGIGTSSPLGRLDINSGTNTKFRVRKNSYTLGYLEGTTDNALRIGSPFSNGIYLATGSDGGVSGFDAAATDRWYLEAGGNFRPIADNSYTLGSASYRVSTVYAATGTINTSDARAKKHIGAIPDAWLDAWGDVDWCRFRFKGGERWHVGLIAQRVHGAFAARGLDAFELGLCCFDSWKKQGRRAAGDRWGLRYDECFAMEAAWQRRELARLRETIRAA